MRREEVAQFPALTCFQEAPRSASCHPPPPAKDPFYPRTLISCRNTSAATWFVKAVLTVFVCGGSRCQAAEVQLDGSLVDYTYIEGLVEAISNLDKRLIQNLFRNDDSGVLGISGGGNEPFAAETLVDQLGLANGSVGAYVLISLATSIAPFMVGYVFLVLHQLWLRQRVSASRPDNQDEDASKLAVFGRQSGGCSMVKHVAVLLGASSILAFVVTIPAVLVGEASPSAEFGAEFNTDVPLVCPGCINGFPQTEGLTASSPGLVSEVVREPLLDRAVKVRKKNCRFVVFCAFEQVNLN